MSVYVCVCVLRCSGMFLYGAYVCLCSPARSIRKISNYNDLCTYLRHEICHDATCKLTHFKQMQNTNNEEAYLRIVAFLFSKYM